MMRSSCLQMQRRINTKTISTEQDYFNHKKVKRTIKEVTKPIFRGS